MMARKCMARGESRERDRMVRFVLDGAGRVWPDVAEKAPGRGVWVSASAGDLQTAIKRKAFAAGFKRKVDVPDDLSAQVAVRLRDQALHMLGLAKRAGFVLVGEPAVREHLRGEAPAVLLEASDGSTRAQGRMIGMARAEWGEDFEVADCFSAEELGRALGRPPCTHVLVHPSKLGDKLALQLQRLSGFTPDAGGRG